MADFQNVSLTDLPNANRNVGRWQVDVDLTDSETGALLQHVTFVWPDDLASLTVQQRRGLRRWVIERCVYMKAGLDDGF